MERNSQETERILAEAKQEKIRYLDEAHAANRKVTELQTRLKLVENRLAEKDAMIRAYQGQKIYGGSTNSYGSYNLSSDSFALNPLGAYNSQASYVDVSSGAFDVTTGTGGSLLDPSSVVVGPYGPAGTAAVVSSYASSYGPTASNPSSFAQSSLNLPTSAGGGGGGSGSGGSGGGAGPGVVGAYSSPGSSSTTSNYSSSANFGAGSEHTIYDSKSYDAQRKSIDDQLKQLDEQLLSKVSELSLVEKQRQLNQQARALAAKLKAVSANGGVGRAGSSGLGTASETSSAGSSADANGNGNLLHVAATNPPKPPGTRNASSSTSAPSCVVVPSSGGKTSQQLRQMAKTAKANSMAKTTSTPAIASKKSPGVTTASVGTNTTASGSGSSNHGKKLAASCKNVSMSTTDSSSSSSGSCSSEPETFY
uniref:Angiomotin C-terminal domain-containing protein n=1 Tax=Anopheles maculatus TaxID=74869 RepID=A0A182SSD6_9DIPT